MCFSATASFIAAAVTGSAGVAALSMVKRRQDVALAAIPMFFSAQQAIEGMLWLTLPVSPEGSSATILIAAFLLFANVFWPVFAPLAALNAECEGRRRAIMALCVLAGLGVSGHFAWVMWNYPLGATIEEHHIVYAEGIPTPLAIGVAYHVATVLAPALSTYRVLKAFAAIVLGSSIFTYLAFWDAYTSVWCFFAAGASVIIALHFLRERQREASASA
jgi:hypothetical protein